MMRYLVCARCQGAGERLDPASDRWRRCGACRGSGSVPATCTTVRPTISIEEPTPMASVIIDQAGKAVDA